jgi:hypothetical protein
MTLTPEDARLVRQVRRALANPFADPVRIDGLPMSRAAARMIERNLTCTTRPLTTA